MFFPRGGIPLSLAFHRLFDAGGISISGVRARCSPAGGGGLSRRGLRPRALRAHAREVSPGLTTRRRRFLSFFIRSRGVHFEGSHR